MTAEATIYRRVERTGPEFGYHTVAPFRELVEKVGRAHLGWDDKRINRSALLQITGCHSGNIHIGRWDNIVCAVALVELEAMMPHISTEQWDGEFLANLHETLKRIAADEAAYLVWE